ncbi:MAG: LptA/OstA family protein [Pseudomonadota bacterium]
MKHALCRMALGSFVGLFLAGAAFAQASVSLGVKDHDTSTPLEITSKSLELDQEVGTAKFIGDVFVRQGPMTMTCALMVVEYKENEETGRDEVHTIRMFGGVTMTSPTEAAESDWAVYSVNEEILEMFDEVLVTQGRTALTSDKLTYNLDTGEGLMEGNVKTVLQRVEEADDGEEEASN